VTGLDVVLQLDGPIGILTLAGEARQEVIHHLQEQADHALAEGVRSLILDCGRLDFMDSASTGVLLRLDKDLSARGGRLVLCAVPRVIQRLLESAGLGGRFQEAPDQPRAREIASQA
jgi:anti-anti-sigma factor